MEKFNEMDDLFGTNLDTKMDFLNEKKPQSADGVYRIDLTKVKDKKRGYRSVVRFLPNLTKEGKVGQAAIEKIAHYVNIKEAKELSGWFDSPKNFGEKCPLTDLYYQMMNSKNVVLQEKAKCLNYSKKYYSYVLVLEDEQQPDLVGKIMLFSYGKTIKDKIAAERNGEITGVSCNIFVLSFVTKMSNFCLSSSKSSSFLDILFWKIFSISSVLVENSSLILPISVVLIEISPFNWSIFDNNSVICSSLEV
jgi:hypothetical protein